MILTISFIFAALFCVAVFADDSPQWGVDQGRNRISRETGLPTTFEPGKKEKETDEIVGAGPNIRWVKRIGSRTYTPPVVAGGCVLIGTNNDVRLDAKIEGDHGVLLCLDEKSGAFRWQYTAPKIPEIKNFDTALIGITSTPTVVGDRIYFISNRDVLCVLELQTGKPIWTLDLIRELGVRQHDTNNSSVVVHDGLLYLGTGNGLDGDHAFVEKPDAPTLLVVDAETGKPVARDDYWNRTDVSHGQWCSPTLGTVVDPDGRKEPTIFYGAGNGVLYVFKALDRSTLKSPEKLDEFGANLHRIQPDWTFDGNGPEAVEEVKPFKSGRGSASFCCLPPPIFVDNRLYMMFCFDGFTGASPRQAYLTAFDPTAKDPKSRLLWKTSNIDKGAIASPVALDGLLYFGDRGGKFHAIDTETGKTVWTLDLKGDHWSGALVADGKLYLGTARRMFYVLQAGREPKILAEIEMPDAIYAGATAANGTLFIPINGFLYAVSESQNPVERRPATE